jgi:hypothetical protein
MNPRGNVTQIENQTLLVIGDYSLSLVNPRGCASKPLKSYHFVVSLFYFWPFTQASLALSLNKKT